MPKVEKFVVRFGLQRETKNALVYGELDDAGVLREQDDPAMVVGSMYNKKRAWIGPEGADTPRRIRVTVERDE